MACCDPNSLGFATDHNCVGFIPHLDLMVGHRISLARAGGDSRIKRRGARPSESHIERPNQAIRRLLNAFGLSVPELNHLPMR